MEEGDFKKLREKMVNDQIFKRGITNPRILEAFSNVLRHRFVPSDKAPVAYEDYPVTIGDGQTISQPYMVALMTELLEVSPGEKILEIGTGSGYQATILNYLGAQVYSVERIDALAHKAKALLILLGLSVKTKVGDGTLGWQEYAPYDKIIVTAASPLISGHWKEQLNIGGKIVFPLGGGLYQDLIVADKISKDELRERQICGCVFVPLIGKYGHKE